MTSTVVPLTEAHFHQLHEVLDEVARELYERLGFQHEGRQYGTFQVDGETFDSHAMALMRDGPR